MASKGTGKPTAARRPTIQNRKAGFDYHFLDTYEAGIMLTGTEVKSIREGKVQLLDAFCNFQGNELFVFNLEIAPWDTGSYNNHSPRRPRKLLLSRQELRKLQVKLKEAGLTIVPKRLYFNDRNLAKLEIALAKGKKDYDKRETLKTRDTERALRRGEA